MIDMNSKIHIQLKLYWKLDTGMKFSKMISYNRFYLLREISVPFQYKMKVLQQQFLQIDLSPLDTAPVIVTIMIQWLFHLLISLPVPALYT